MNTYFFKLFVFFLVVVVSGCGTQVRNKPIPGGGLKSVISAGDKAAGIEIHEEKYSEEERLVIKPFSGKEGPDYNEGVREEKRRLREMKDQDEQQLAVDLAREDAIKGACGRQIHKVPGKYVWLYTEECENLEGDTQYSDFERYRDNEFRRGQEDFRRKNPNYENYGQAVDMIRGKAQMDASQGIYDPYGFDPRFLGEYDKAHREEVHRLELLYRQRW